MANTWAFAGMMDHIRSELTQHQKIVVAYGLQQVILRSPVDRGAYRSNHRVSIGSADDGYSPDDTSNNALQRGLSEVSSMTVPFTTAFIQNNLPYAQKLEQGHSQQAPNGIYRLAANDIAERYG